MEKDHNNMQSDLEVWKETVSRVKTALSAPVDEFYLNNYIIRDGFVFCRLGEMSAPRVFDAIVLRSPADAVAEFPQFPFSDRSLEEHIALINDLKIEKAVVIADSIGFLPRCTSLQMLSIHPSRNAWTNGFDYSPLYELPKIVSLNCTTDDSLAKKELATIDYSRIPSLRRLGVCGRGHYNFETLPELESLAWNGDKIQRDLTQVCRTATLKDLSIVSSRLESLHGIECNSKLNRLELAYNRCLEDVSELGKIGGSLRKLSIENCSKIRDFSFLQEMRELRWLRLWGRNTIPDLSFIGAMPHLSFIDIQMNVADGDLTPCLGVSFASCTNRKHYNLKDKDLPKRFIETK